MSEDNQNNSELIQHLTNNYLNTVRFVDVIEFVKQKALQEVHQEVEKMSDLEKTNLLAEIKKQIEEQSQLKVDMQPS